MSSQIIYNVIALNCTVRYHLSGAVTHCLIQSWWSSEFFFAAGFLDVFPRRLKMKGLKKKHYTVNLIFSCLPFSCKKVYLSSPGFFPIQSLFHVLCKELDYDGNHKWSRTNPGRPHQSSLRPPQPGFCQCQPPDHTPHKGLGSPGLRNFCFSVPLSFFISFSLSFFLSLSFFPSSHFPCHAPFPSVVCSLS